MNIYIYIYTYIYIHVNIYYFTFAKDILQGIFHLWCSACTRIKPPEKYLFNFNINVTRIIVVT